MATKRSEAEADAAVGAVREALEAYLADLARDRRRRVDPGTAGAYSEHRRAEAEEWYAGRHGAGATERWLGWLAADTLWVAAEDLRDPRPRGPRPRRP